jgi:hypothetical protein
VAVGASSRRHLRFLLPVLLSLLAVALIRGGETQIERIEERMMMMGWGRDSSLSGFAVEEAVGDALNAPAWALAEHTPGFPALRRVALWSLERDERAIFYLTFVAIMWYFIGAVLDKGISSPDSIHTTASRWKHALVRIGLAALGVLLWHDTILQLYRPIHIDWIQASALGWGILLVFAAIYPPLSYRRRTWRLFLGSLGILVGLYNMREAISGYRRARLLSLDFSFSLPPIMWSGILILGSFCALLGLRQKDAIRT